MLSLMLALALAQGSSSMAGPALAAVHSGRTADYFSSLLTSNPATECDCQDLLTTAAEAVTTTRASTAYCTASTGVLTSCAVNKPRVSNAGLLVEGARTNLLLRSQEFDNGSWATGSVGSGTVPTVTANAAVAPDGTATAEQIVFGAVAAGSNGSWIEQAVTMTAAAHGAGIYMKGASGTGTAYFFGTPDNSTYLTVACAWNSTTWTKCIGTGTATAAAWNWRIGSDGRGATMSGGMAAQTVYVWGGQVELGDFASSYIPTAGTSVARAGENISVTPSQAMGTAGCISAVVSFPSDVDPSGLKLLSSFSADVAAGNGNTRLFSNDAGGGVSVFSPFVADIRGRSVSFRVSWGGSTKSVDLDGSVGTPGSFTGPMVGGGAAFFLGSNVGVIQHSFAHQRAFKFGTTQAGCQ